MADSIPLSDFLIRPGAILDVRSPTEFLQGRLPHSYSFPLFSDEERTLVGTCYKQIGRQAAIDMGLEIVCPKLPVFVQSGRELLQSTAGRFLCWRGGMRSHFVANLFESIGYKCHTLQGGYKTFRRWVLKTLENLNAATIYVLGGLTGAGKTEILHQLRQMGEQVIDLEGLAHHYGSAFGAIKEPYQPSQEQFENELATEWNQFDFSKPIWIEDESRMIGRCHVPPTLYQKMEKAPVFYIERTQEERLTLLLELYGQASSNWLIECTHRIDRRLGGQLTQQVIAAFENDQKAEAFVLLLSYYDRTYQHQITKKNRSQHIIHGKGLSSMEWAQQLVLMKVTR